MPFPISSYSKARDADPSNEDHIGLVLDTFRDGRSGYVFAVNPSGARFDGLVVNQGQDINASWDGIWEAATWRDGNNWSTEIRIPLRSLIFRPGLTSWGFNVQRQVQAAHPAQLLTRPDADQFHSVRHRHQDPGNQRQAALDLRSRRSALRGLQPQPSGSGQPASF